MIQEMRKTLTDFLQTQADTRTQLCRLEVAGLNVAEGDHVYLVPKKLSVFEHKGVAA